MYELTTASCLTKDETCPPLQRPQTGTAEHHPYNLHNGTLDGVTTDTVCQDDYCQALTCVDVDAHAALFPELRYVQHQDALKNDHLGRVNLYDTAAMRVFSSCQWLVLIYGMVPQNSTSVFLPGDNLLLQQASQCR